MYLRFEGGVSKARLLPAIVPPIASVVIRAVRNITMLSAVNNSGVINKTVSIASAISARDIITQDFLLIPLIANPRAIATTPAPIVCLLYTSPSPRD